MAEKTKNQENIFAKVSSFVNMRNQNPSNIKKSDDDDTSLNNGATHNTVKDTNNDSRVAQGALTAEMSIEQSRVALKGIEDRYDLSSSDGLRDPRIQELAKRKAFGENLTVKDKLTGDTLYRTHADAIEAGHINDTTRHVANADHVVPLNETYTKHKNDSFVSKEDLKNTINSSDNFEMISESRNKSMGDKSKSEYLSDKDNLDKYGISEKNAKKSIQEYEQKRIQQDKELFYKNIKNMGAEAHNAGVQGAKYAAAAAATMSLATNIVDVVKGKKNLSTALKETAVISAKAGVAGYASTGALTVINRSLLTSNSPFLKSLGTSNVPAKIVIGASVVGKSVVDFLKGDISGEDCLKQIGRNSIEFAAVSESAAIGQALIPIPVVGAVVGSIVGMALTSSILNYSQQQKIKAKEHEERMAIQEQCDALIAQMDEYQKELDEYLNKYFTELKAFFSSSLLEIKSAVLSGDNFEVVKATNSFITGMGGTADYNNIDEFKEFLNSEEADEF